MLTSFPSLHLQFKQLLVHQRYFADAGDLHCQTSPVVVAKHQADVDSVLESSDST
jgi:hypothetical protein